jgi:hypothetical protein
LQRFDEGRGYIGASNLKEAGGHAGFMDSSYGVEHWFGRGCRLQSPVKEGRYVNDRNEGHRRRNGGDSNLKRSRRKSESRSSSAGCRYIRSKGG